MILFDVLEIFDENKKIDVWDCVEPDNLLTFYDGCNSIDMVYNYCDVTSLSTHFDEYDNETVLDVYIKQDPKTICRGIIADYIRNEFEHSESEIQDDISGDIIDIGVSYYDTQASYDINAQVLILDGHEIVKYIPVSYEEINNYLDYGWLCARLDEISELLGYEV